MSTVRARIHGREYALACDDGQEAQLQQLIDAVNSRAERLGKHLGKTVPENMLLLYTALTLADEMQQAQLQGERLSRAAEAAGSDAKLFSLQEEMATNLQDLAARIHRIADQLEA